MEMSLMSDWFIHVLLYYVYVIICMNFKLLIKTYSTDLNLGIVCFCGLFLLSLQCRSTKRVVSFTWYLILSKSFTSGILVRFN